MINVQTVALMYLALAYECPTCLMALHDAILVGLVIGIVHVAYLGRSAVRAWITHLSTVPQRLYRRKRCLAFFAVAAGLVGHLLTNL